MSYPEPDALLLLSPGCAHCPSVLEGLSQLLKKGELGRLEVVNILAHPVIDPIRIVVTFPEHLDIIEISVGHMP